MRPDRYANFEFLRVKHIVQPDGVLPISKSTWWAGVKSGKYPKPVSSNLLGVGVTSWRKNDIQTLINIINDDEEKFNE